MSKRRAALVSVLLPYLSSSKCVSTCKRLVEKNTSIPIELVEAVDVAGAYNAYNECAERAKGEILVFLNDDMFVAPDWDVELVQAAGPRSVVTTYLVESGRLPVNDRNIELDFGRDPETFDEKGFASFVEAHQRTVPPVATGFGWFMPFAIRKSDFVPFPTNAGWPNDFLLFGRFAALGYKFLRARSYAYHLQRMTGADLG